MIYRQRLGVVMVVALLAMLLAPMAAQADVAWPAFVAQIRGASGAVMGSATISFDMFGQAIIDVQVSGFNPVGGDHRLAITDVGFCCPPSFHCGGNEIVVLPNIQFYPDGSANYHVVTTALQPGHLNGVNGSTIVIHADVAPYSAIIGCGVIVPSGGFPVPPPGPVYPCPVPPYPVPPYPTPPPSYQTAQVNAPAGLKLRTEPKLAAPVILTLFHGEYVTLLSAPFFNDGLSWTFVQVCRGTQCWNGYAASAYLSTGGVAPPPTGMRMKVVASAGLRLRSGPGTGYAIKRIVPFGTILQTTGVEQTGSGLVWVQVQIDGIYLWAAKNYLQAV